MRLPTPASRPRRCAGGPSGRALTPTPATTRPPRRGAPPGPRFAPAPRHDAPNTRRSRQGEGPASPSSRVDRPHSFRNDLRKRGSRLWEPPVVSPVGIEPTTYALRGRRAVSPALPPALIGHRTPLRAPGHLGERQPRCQNGCQRRRGVPPNPTDLAYASPDSAR